MFGKRKRNPMGFVPMKPSSSMPTMSFTPTPPPSLPKPTTTFVPMTPTISIPSMTPSGGSSSSGSSSSLPTFTPNIPSASTPSGMPAASTSSGGSSSSSSGSSSSGGSFTMTPVTPSGGSSSSSGSSSSGSSFQPSNSSSFDASPESQAEPSVSDPFNFATVFGSLPSIVQTRYKSINRTLDSNWATNSPKNIVITNTENWISKLDGDIALINGEKQRSTKLKNDFAAVKPLTAFQVSSFNSHINSLDKLLSDILATKQRADAARINAVNALNQAAVSEPQLPAVIEQPQLPATTQPMPMPQQEPVIVTTPAAEPAIPATPSQVAIPTQTTVPTTVAVPTQTTVPAQPTEVPSQSTSVATTGFDLKAFYEQNKTLVLLGGLAGLWYFFGQKKAPKRNPRKRKNSKKRTVRKNKRRSGYHRS